MTESELELEVKRILERMEDENFTSRMFSNFESLSFDEEFWSRGPAYVLLPYGLELTGYPPAKKFSKRLKGDKNLHHYKVSGGNVVSSVSLNEKGCIVDVEVFLQESEKYFSIRFDNDQLPVSSTELCTLEGKVDFAIRVDIDGDYWAYKYFYEGGKVVKMLANASNSPPNIEIYVEYEVDELSGIYFWKSGHKVYLYGG
ncbi:hypothetical protein [Pseudomonas putida]